MGWGGGGSRNSSDARVTHRWRHRRRPRGCRGPAGLDLRDRQLRERLERRPAERQRERARERELVAVDRLLREGPPEVEDGGDVIDDRAVVDVVGRARGAVEAETIGIVS